MRAKKKRIYYLRKVTKFCFSYFRNSAPFSLINTLCYLLFIDKLVQENVHKRKIAREIVMEKLLTLIEMPIIEPLLDIDYTNDMPCSNEVDNSLVEILNESYDFSKCEM